MMSAIKRKQSRLSIQDKVKIIESLENGETGASLARRFNVHAATICDIKGKKSEILDKASKLESGDGREKRKIIKKARNLVTEDAVYSWFMEMRSQGVSITGPALCRKALELNRKIGGPSKFKASSAWLRNFKYRHGIKFTDIHKEAFSNDGPTAGCFRQSVLKMIEEEGFCMDDIYNADETRICLKSLLCESLSVQLDMSNVDLDADEEPITVMICANASGQHALPLYVVTKYGDSNNFSEKTSLPIKYKVQKHAWIDYNTFLDWFSHHFIPEVKMYRAREGMTGKVLLLVDSSTSHSPLEEINKIDDNFVVRFLPPVVEQPTNQGITQTVETIYVKNLQSLCSREENLIEFLNDLSFKDCCSVLACSWKRLPKGNFKKAWQRFWKALDEAVVHEENPKKAFSENVSSFTEQGCEEWLEDEISDSGCEIINNGDIRDEVEKTGSTPSHAEALIAFQTVIRWCEEQAECNSDDIALLKWMKDLSERKMQSSI